MSHSERVILARTFLCDELPTDNLDPHTVPRLSALAHADYTDPVAPQPGFPFSEAMINHFQKIQQELQTSPKGKSHRFASVARSKENMYSPLELPSTNFQFSRDSPVVDREFTEISRSQDGGTRLGTEQKYFRDLTYMTRRRLCTSFQDWTGAALNQSIQGLIDHVGIGNVFTEQLLEQLKTTLQLSQSVATAWSDGATLDCTIAYNILLHQRDQALRGVSRLVSQEERERFRTAPFGSSSLFDELATKLQLRDKVASRQRDI